jgi:Predicted metal-dependent hydrolase
MKNMSEQMEPVTHCVVASDGRTIEYYLTRKNVKNVNLRIKSDGRVLVSANKRVPLKYINEFVQSKGIWINQVIDAYAEKRDQEKGPMQFEEGEQFRFLGKDLRLQILEGKEEGVTSDGHTLLLVVKNKEDLRRKERLIHNWLKEQQIRIFDEICRNVYPIFIQYGIDYPEIRIRSMKSRWGSCQPKKRVITLNSQLIEVPRSGIEYVVLHEFAHFIHPNHSRQFYQFVEQYMPDWKERKQGLNR